MRDSTATMALHRDQIMTILAHLHGQPPSRPTAPVSETRYRHFYQHGFINDSDVSAAFREHPALLAGQTLCAVGTRTITRADIYRAALLFDMDTRAENRFGAGRDTVQLSDKAAWAYLLATLEPRQNATPCVGLAASNTPSASPAEPHSPLHDTLRQLATAELERLFAELGGTRSLPALLYLLSGEDMLAQINPQLQQALNLLETTASAWTTREHHQLGGYGLWRALARQDASLFLHQLPDWQNIMAQLPEDAVSAIALQLHGFDIAPAYWAAYLQQLTRELPAQTPPAPLADLLAIRLTLDRLWLNQVCHDVWKTEAKISALQGYFRKNLSEFWVRLQLYQGMLPEHLSLQAQTLIIRSGSERHCRTDWQQLADSLVLRQRCLANTATQEATAWRLLCLCHNVGLSDTLVQQLSQPQLLALESVLDDFQWADREKIWRTAEAHHYQQAFPAFFATASPSLQIVHLENHWANRMVGLSDFTRKRLVQTSTNPLSGYAMTFFHAPIVLAQTLLGILFPASPQNAANTQPLSDECLASIAHFLHDAQLTGDFADGVVLLDSHPFGQNDGNHLHRLAAWLNQKDTHKRLKPYGIFIPSKTWFVAGNYDTIASDWIDGIPTPQP